MGVRERERNGERGGEEYSCICGRRGDASVEMKPHPSSHPISTHHSRSGHRDGERGRERERRKRGTNTGLWEFKKASPSSPQALGGGFSPFAHFQSVVFLPKPQSLPSSPSPFFLFFLHFSKSKNPGESRALGKTCQETVVFGVLAHSHHSKNERRNFFLCFFSPFYFFFSSAAQKCVGRRKMLLLM